MKQDEIDRALLLFYRSRNEHDYIDFVREICWLDNLPMKGLKELVSLMKSITFDVEEEIARREKEGMLVYSRKYYENEK